MKILGIDYGKARFGLALAEGTMAEPLTVLDVKNIQGTIGLLSGIIHQHEIKAIVIGVSEGLMAAKSKEFAQLLKTTFQLPVFEVDETLTTVEAQRRLIEGKKKPRQRKKVIDAAAAAIILQSWLDTRTGQESMRL